MIQDVEPQEKTRIAPGVLAVVTMLGMLCLGFVSYCGVVAWQEHRLTSIPDGTTKAEIEKAFGEPDSREFSGLVCRDRKVVNVWMYRVGTSTFVELGFDAEGRLVCKSSGWTITAT